ncbi:MAG: DNA gyrase inhibitor YacG [Alphaproteobacteria bacterium]
MTPGARRCPICGKRSAPRYRPFCSGRCADIDLGRWLKGAYRVETEEPPEEGSEANEP